MEQKLTAQEYLYQNVSKVGWKVQNLMQSYADYCTKMESVEFAEWAGMNYRPLTENGNAKIWRTKNMSEKYGDYTTEQLYELYKQLKTE